MLCCKLVCFYYTVVYTIISKSCLFFIVFIRKLDYSDTLGVQLHQLFNFNQQHLADIAFTIPLILVYYLFIYVYIIKPELCMNLNKQNIILFTIHIPPQFLVILRIDCPPCSGAVGLYSTTYLLKSLLCIVRENPLQTKTSVVDIYNFFRNDNYALTL